MDFPLRPPLSGVAADREYDRAHIRRIWEYWDIQNQAAAARSRRLHRRVLSRLSRFRRR